jgi:hypothetical protein
MVAGLQAISTFWTSPNLPLALLIKTLAGATLYTVAVVLLWCAAGRPAGAESYLLGYFMGSSKEKRI